MSDCGCAACRERGESDPAVLPEMDEMELAAELLDALSADLGGRRLDGMLRRTMAEAARATGLPLAPAAIGRLVPIARRLVSSALPPAVGPIGQRAAPDARTARLFGIELEGLSPEDSELETARRAVRFARAAAQATARAGRRLPAALAARRGTLAAARRWAPGLLVRTGPAAAALSGPAVPTVVDASLEPPATASPEQREPTGSSRRAWARRGQSIIVYC
jgi:hypothetical protein